MPCGVEVIAVDTNIFLDILIPDTIYSSLSLDALRAAGRHAQLVVCEIVYAEVAAQFAGTGLNVEHFFRDAQVSLHHSSQSVLRTAGVSWREYKRRGGSRERIVADFLIGAHAMSETKALITRDEKFYKTNFKNLSVINPAK